MPKARNSPVIVLVAPQMGENIGAAARAMLNFGLHDLRIVNPRDGWPNQAAIDMAAGALEIMPAPPVFTTLAEALADCHFVYGTTVRKRGMVKPVFTARGAVADAHERTVQKQKTAFVFGPERTGLDNDEIALCHAIVTVPVNPDFSSLNLAQSVLLVAYEWLSLQDSTPDKMIDAGDRFPVTHEKLEEFLTRLEAALDTGGFFRAGDLKPTMLRNIRSMFTRADLTDQEVRTLHGMVSALSGKKA